jgi:hypothetical protein
MLTAFCPKLYVSTAENESSTRVLGVQKFPDSIFSLNIDYTDRKVSVIFSVSSDITPRHCVKL